jgi:hypothetical protein
VCVLGRHQIPQPQQQQHFIFLFSSHWFLTLIIRLFLSSLLSFFPVISRPPSGTMVATVWQVDGNPSGSWPPIADWEYAHNRSAQFRLDLGSHRFLYFVRGYFIPPSQGAMQR